MSSEMYSTNPTLVGGILIGGTAWLAVRNGPIAEPSVWPCVTVGIGYLFFAMAMSITSSVGLSGHLRVCSILAALPSAYAVGWLWKTPYFPLAIVCGVGGAAILGWGWIAAWVIDRPQKGAPPGAF